MLMKPVFKPTPAAHITCRVLLSVIGGYVIANLSAMLISYLPSDNKVDGIVAGMMSSFIIYTLIVIVVFAVKSTTRAIFFIALLVVLLSVLVMYLEKAI